MDNCTLAACAKINLSLDVVGRRPDGYHLLEMVMQSVSLHDTVFLQKNADGAVRLTCSDPTLPTGEGNIAHRAATLFLRHCGLSAGVDIHIEKQIPCQAGLAGGSADGAAVLVGLNQLFAAGLSEEDLCALGVQIGADVPFCICGGTRLCRGIGEIMTPLPPLPDCTILLCKPEIDVSTGQAYGQIDRGVIARRPDTDALCQALQSSDLAAVGRHLENVFEAALPLPEVDAIKAKMLELGALGACMTGSGSTVFSLFDDKGRAERCAAALRETYQKVFYTTPIPWGVALIESIGKIHSQCGKKPEKPD